MEIIDSLKSRWVRMPALLQSLSGLGVKPVALDSISDSALAYLAIDPKPLSMIVNSKVRYETNKPCR